MLVSLKPKEEHKKWLHRYMKRILVKPDCCENCSKCLPLDLSNKSQRYTKDKKDWQWLCRECHTKYDSKHPDSKVASKFLTEEQIKEVARLNEEGISYRKIGKMFGVSHVSIFNYLHSSVVQ